MRLLILACFLTTPVFAGEMAPPPRTKAPADKKAPGMPLTGLAPAKLSPNLCLLKYPVSTRSPECQQFCDQALGYYYSYVWIEAARSFETALQYDPNCAFAWLGLYRGMDKWGRGASLKPDGFRAVASAAWPDSKLPDVFSKSMKDYALEQAKRLIPKANHREQLLIQAKLQERGMWPNTPAEERRKKAQQTLDELLGLYDDDEEGWFARAQVADGQYGPAVFYKALLRINPLHPGANHEFVHFYENVRRPALGWPYAEKYMESSPGLPHAYHMQAHLATRIGKWEYTADWSKRAYEMQKAYHTFQGVKPSEDHQFNHHMDILLRGLLHDGRITEAKKLLEEAKGYNYTFRNEMFKLAMMEKDWVQVEDHVKQFRKQDKVTGSYYAALMYLERGETVRANAEVDVLRQAKKGGKQNEFRLWETQGRLLCQQGQGEAGVKMLRKIIEKTKDDFSHHAWGNGAVYMESWGIAALEAGMAVEAEEAFQEALAHDAGSVKGALGLFALCERLGRTEEAARYMKVARKCWTKADTKLFESLKNDMLSRAQNVASVAAPTASR